MPYCRPWPACTPLWHPPLDPRAYLTSPGGPTGHSIPVPYVLLLWTASHCPIGCTGPPQPAPWAVPQACILPGSRHHACFLLVCTAVSARSCGLSCCACCACWGDLFKAHCNIADSKTRHSTAKHATKGLSMQHLTELTSNTCFTFAVNTATLLQGTRHTLKLSGCSQAGNFGNCDVVPELLCFKTFAMR